MNNEKKSLVVKLFGFLFLIPFYYITKNNNIFLYAFSYSLYLILISVFSNINIESVLKKYYNLEYYYIKEKIFKMTFLTIIVISLFITLLSGGVGYLLEYLLNVKGVMIVYFVMSLTVFTEPCVSILKDYLVAHNFKKISNELMNIYNVLNIIFLLLISIISFMQLKIPENIKISLLYLSNVFAFIATYLLVYFVAIRKNNKIKRKEKITREEYRINVKNIIKNIFSDNINISIIDMSKYSYIYLSILFVYFALIRKYRYSYDDTTAIINITYFYGIQLIALICTVIQYFNRNQMNNMKETIYQKKWINVPKLFKNDFNDLLKIILPIMILISILATPIWVLIFGNSNGAYVLMFLAYMILFVIYYLIVIEILRSINNYRNLLLYIFSGIIIKLIITLPLIDSFYRMGYSLIYGDIASNIIVGLISVILGIIIINNKIKLNLLTEFDSILRIIYENIILCFILVLLDLIIPTNTTNRLSAIGIILIYGMVFALFYEVKRRLMKNNK